MALPVEDPGWGLPTFKDELIRRTRHDGPYFQQDNRAVWKIIRKITPGGPGWSWVSSHSNQQNGREAYFSIKRHYLGECFQARTKAQADKVLDTAFYDGKARNFTFEKYCEKLTRAFNDLAEGEQPLPTSRKIRTLLNGIRDPAPEHAKTPNLKNNFDAAMNFIEFADTRESMQAKVRNISAAGRSGRGGRRGRGRGAGRGGRGRGRGDRGRGGRGSPRSAFNAQDPGQYYTPEQWSTLTAEERDKARTAQDNDPNFRRRNISAVE